MTILRAALFLCGLAFIGACIWAGINGHFLQEFQTISAFAWGKISLIDLYLGFLVLAVIVLIFEPLRIALPVILLLFVFGNWVAAFWLALRLPTLVKRLRQTN